MEVGIAEERIRLKRDPSPVSIAPGTRPLHRPAGADQRLLLYSGNWGVAHDYATFLAAYKAHHTQGSGRIVLWLNASGTAVKAIEEELVNANLPFVRGAPVPLEELPNLLITPDAHLITLSDAFVGYVLPSKLYGCIESGRPVLFIGSARSDVHRMCKKHLPGAYTRVDVGDADGCQRALEHLARAISYPTDAASSDSLGR